MGTPAEVVGKIKEKERNLILILTENDGICRCNCEFRVINYARNPKERSTDESDCKSVAMNSPSSMFGKLTE